MVKLIACNEPSAVLYAREVRESPMLHNVILFSRMTAHVNVVPEKSVSIDGSKTNTRKYIIRVVKREEKAHGKRGGYVQMEH